MIQKINLSIIIVHFNTFDLTKNCLSSVFASLKTATDWEVILVDNGSTDDSLEKLKEYCIVEKLHPTVTIVESKHNLGFAKGNNLGIEKSKKEFILLLNSDTEIVADAITTSLEEFQDKDVGVVGCALVLPSGEIDPACHRGFPTPWASLTYYLGLERLFPKSVYFSQYHLGYLKKNEVHEVDAISGAFFLVRRSTLSKVGLLDEDYFMYGEDLDLAYKIKKLGLKVVYSPRGKVIHFKKRSGLKSTDKDIQKKIKVHFYNSMRIFYIKHYSSQYPALITYMILQFLTVRIHIVSIFGL